MHHHALVLALHAWLYPNSKDSLNFLYGVGGCVTCLLLRWMSRSVSSRQICWSGRLEPAEANIGAPGTAFGCEVIDGG